MIESYLILQPVVALLLLNCVMLIWLYATRLPAMLKMNAKPDPEIPPAQLAAMLPARVRWKADNYNHLLEQPVMFYAVALTLAILGAGNDLNLTLAWAYVVLRMAHSIIQSVWNNIIVRFTVFAIASIILIVLILRTALLVL